MDTIRGKSAPCGTLGDCAEVDTADLVTRDEFHRMKGIFQLWDTSLGPQTSFQHPILS